MKQLERLLISSCAAYGAIASRYRMYASPDVRRFFSSACREFGDIVAAS
jgi:hypothetical protein